METGDFHESEVHAANGSKWTAIYAEGSNLSYKTVMVSDDIHAASSEIRKVMKIMEVTEI